MASDFIVLSHREPYESVETEGGGVERRLKTNGVFRTLDTVMRERQGTWIAWSENDGSDEFTSHLRVPGAEAADAYTVRRIPLTEGEARRFYYDFTSTAIWPVLFSLLDRARFTAEAWETYCKVNRAFADATCEEAAEGALVWVNDFHLMLAPRLIKQRRPDLTITLFLHTVFPPPDIFGVIPWRRDLLDGLLHLDLIGFHVPSYVLNFANTVERFMNARPADKEPTELIDDGPAVAVSRYPRHLRYRDRRIELRACPVGVDVDQLSELARSPDVIAHGDEIRESTGAEVVVLSAERLDYVKGMIERLECFERFLARHDEWHERISFIQIAVPTRTGMEEFQEMRRLTEEAVGRINGRFGNVSWKPVYHFYTSFPIDELAAYYAAADIAWVTPLRDGLNLVAKEYIASRVSGDGLVILSEFAGAAAELDGVVLTNPYSPDDMDRALESALGMSSAERRRRMARLRERVHDYDVGWWARRFLGDAESVQETRNVLIAP